MTHTEDFEACCWHDNVIHGLRIVEGNDGVSGDLVLDIDYILEWLAPQPGKNLLAFKISPANLTFHETTNLRISIDYAAASTAFQPMSIDEIHREPLIFPNGYTTFAWRIEIDWPPNSTISFQSPRFSLALRREPLISRSQVLPVSERAQ